MRPQSVDAQLARVRAWTTLRSKSKSNSEGAEEVMDPAEFYDNIMEQRRRSVEQVHALLEGTTDEYDDIHQILDDFAWSVKGIVLRMLKEDNAN